MKAKRDALFSDEERTLWGNLPHRGGQMAKAKAKAKARVGVGSQRSRFAKRMHGRLTEVIAILEDEGLFNSDSVPGNESCVPEPFAGAMALVEIAHNTLYQAKVQLQLRYKEL